MDALAAFQASSDPSSPYYVQPSSYTDPLLAPLDFSQGDQTWFNAPSIPAVQVVQTTNTNTGDTGAYTTDPATQQAAAQTAAQLSAINQVYDSRNGRLTNMLGQIPTQQDTALNMYNTSWDTNKGALDNARTQGLNSLDFNAAQNEQQKVRSYRDIASGIRNTLESASNRLGTMNASDSSVAPMLAYALANLQAQQRGQANDVYGSNMGQLNLARTNMEGDYTQQLNALNAEKRNRIQEIADKYAQTRQQIMDEMATSDEARTYELANLGQHYTMKTLADITALENQYNQASQQWVSQATAKMPSVNTQAYQAPAMNSYGTYGRGASVDGNQPLSYQDALAVSPLRKIRETA